MKRSIGTLPRIIENLRGSAQPVFLTSILYRIIAFVLYAPLISGLTWLFLKGSGRIVVSNEEIASFLLEPIGILALIVMASIGITLFALEQACLMIILFEPREKTVSMATGTLKFVFARSGVILQLAIRIVVKALIIAAPFLIIAFLIYIFFLTEHDINFYLTEQPPIFRWAASAGIILGIGFIICLLIFATRVLFALPLLMFEGKSPQQALKDSAALSSRNHLRIVTAISVWGAGTFFAVTVFGGAFIGLGKLLVPIAIGYMPLLIFLLGALFFFLSLAQLAVNILATASFSALIMALYYSISPIRGSLKPVINSDPDFKENQKNVHLGKIIIFCGIFLGIAAGIIGWMLISDVDMDDRTQIIAHRGSSRAAPENTLAAVDQAIADGAHWVEIDVQRTEDDRVVVVHDRDLMKIGRKPVVVARSSYSDLAEIDIGSWFDAAFSDQRIITLDELLNRCRGYIKVNIELKYYGWDEKLALRVVEIVEDTGMVNDVVIMSLKLEAVDQVKTLRPDWRAGQLTAMSLGNLTRLKSDFLAVHTRTVTPGFVRRVHRAGKELMVWTVNDTAGMTKYFGMGVDGLITDEPALAVELLEQRADMEPIEKVLISLGLLVVGEVEHVDPMTDGF